jgi:hypothetical protein
MLHYIAFGRSSHGLLMAAVVRNRRRDCMRMCLVRLHGGRCKVIAAA